MWVSFPSFFLIVRPRRGRRMVWLLPSPSCEDLETICKAWRTRPLAREALVALIVDGRSATARRR